MSVVIVDHEDEEGDRRKSDCNLSSIGTHQVFVQQRPDDVVYSQGQEIGQMRGDEVDHKPFLMSGCK